MEDFLVPWFILDMNQILERIVQGHIVEAKMTFILDMWKITLSRFEFGLGPISLM